MNTIDRKGFCSCALALLAAPATGQATAGSAAEAKAASDDLTQPVNSGQVMSFLRSVDGSGDEALRGAVFERWGRECFYSRKLDQWALGQRANVDGYVAWVNEGHSRYWERLEYDKAAGTLRVIGRKVPHCVCAWAQCPEPPKSLCTHCCRAFQAEVFRTILSRKVEVEVTESVLLGGERCSTTIRILPSAD